VGGLQNVHNMEEAIPHGLCLASMAAAILVGGVIGVVEAFFEHKLKRPTPWPRLLP
jgi:hypothetical protein